MGRPRAIILIRHGESESNIDKEVNRVIPNHLVQLTERGHQQARDAGEKLRQILRPDDTVLFYTSPYQRARQTAQNILDVMDEGNVDYRVYEEARIREQDFGNFQGSTKEMKAMWKARAEYGHFFFRVPNGESAADVYDRCAGFNESLFRQFSSEKFPSILVLVTHGIWARVFVMKWFRWTYETFESLRNIPHCKLIIMEKNEAPDHRYTLKTRLATWDDEEELSDTDEGTHIGDDLTIAVSDKNDLKDLTEKERAIQLAAQGDDIHKTESPNNRRNDRSSINGNTNQNTDKKDTKNTKDRSYEEKDESGCD